MTQTSNTIYNKLINNLETLGFNQIESNLEIYMDYLSEGTKTFVEALYELTEYEVTKKQQRAMNACVKVANFPFIKRFEDFNFSFQPSINKEQILDFKYLRFIENKENIIFVGSPGVGKTHLATSIGIETASNRKLTYFIHCNDLILQLKRAHLENRLEQKLKFFTKYKLLIIDELGFIPLDDEASKLLFQLISRRYEKVSTIITTNKQLSQWGEVFEDNVLANAILDRLLHHSHVISITGRSYRTKDILEDSD